MCVLSQKSKFFKYFWKKGGDKKHKLKKEFWKIPVIDIQHNQHFLGQLRKENKAFIFVNVATKCDFSAINLKALNVMYATFQQCGLEIIGFPCNQFWK